LLQVVEVVVDPLYTLPHPHPQQELQDLQVDLAEVPAELMELHHLHHLQLLVVLQLQLQQFKVIVAVIRVAQGLLPEVEEEEQVKQVHYHEVYLDGIRCYLHLLMELLDL
jgi:hypothetical protein